MTDDFLRQPNFQPEITPEADPEKATGPTFTWNSFTTADMRFPTTATAPDALLLTGGGGPGDGRTLQVAETRTGQGDQSGQSGDDKDVDARMQKLLDQAQQGDTGGPEQFDQRWNAVLNDANIDRSHSDKTDGQGHELWDRNTDEVQTIEVRRGHKDGDPPANYVIDKQGKVHELIPPNKKAMGAGDDQVVIEYDDSEGAATQAQNAMQSAAANAIIGEIQANAAHAGLAPDIPSDILDMLVAKAVPAPRPVMRGGPGGMPSVPGFSNGGNAGPAGGGFARPSIPNRAPVGKVDAAVKPTESHFDGSGIKDTAVRKIVTDVVGKNEGRPTSINWNDNGHGISAGIFQWNQKSGELPMLLQRMAKDHPQEFNKAFGADAENMTKESFIRGANISPNSKLGAEMQTALNDPVLQQTQVQLAAEKVKNCAAVAAKHGVTSEAGTAMFVDLVNQFGMGDSHRGALKYLMAAESHGGSEQQKFAALDASSRQDSHWRADRNPKVVQEIKDAKLSFESGSMLGGIGGDRTENA